MTRNSLAHIIKKQIPLTRAMGLKVIRCSVVNGVEFSLPLKPNRNHKNTAFGGTLVAGQALASWAWLMALLEEWGVEAEVVVQRQVGEFLKPIDHNFRVITNKVLVKDVNHFFKTLKRHGKARIVISARVLNKGELAATYRGEYVAISNHELNIK
jgi:thioesterase domain-containing protein